MRVRLLANLALAALIAALVAVLVLEPGLEDGRTVRLLSDIDPATVSRVRVEPDAGASFELERRAEAWWLNTKPTALPADPFRVQALLGVLRARSHGGFRAAGNDLAEFGLAPPRIRLEVDGQVLAFGDTEAIDGRRYVLYDAEVHLVDDRQYQHLSARARNFVHPSPLGPGARPVALSLPGLSLRREGGRWESDPERPDLGADARVGLAQAWARSRALRVSAFDPAGAWRERVTVLVEGGAAPVDIAVWDAGHEVILGRADLGVQWHFVKRVGDQLLARGL